ncbi:hypothetical protein YC2023_071952 [Brassica napus]
MASTLKKESRPIGVRSKYSRSKKFLSPSICEYPTLEANSSPRKERPEQRPIIGFKRDLSSFQKPKIRRNGHGIMKHWRPGDHFNQSGDIIHGQEEFYKSIPCTSSHWIRRILIYSNLPYLEQTDINVLQLFPLQFRHDLSTFQAVKKVPRKLTYPLKPSRFKKDQILYLEPKSHKRLQRLLSTQIERVNHFDPSFHQIERFNQTFLRKSTSVHLLIKLRVIHIQQLDSILSFSEAGWELSRTGSKHDGIEARRENPKLGENPNFGITKFFEEAGGSGNIFKGYQTSSRIRMDVEKYLGLIAGRKFTGMIEIRRMDREARGGSLQGFRTWCQPSSKLSVYRSSRCRRAWKQSMQPDT